MHWLMGPMHLQSPQIFSSSYFACLISACYFCHRTYLNYFGLCNTRSTHKERVGYLFFLHRRCLDYLGSVRIDRTVTYTGGFLASQALDMHVRTASPMHVPLFNDSKDSWQHFGMGVDKIFSQLLPVVNVVGIMVTCTVSYISTLAPKKYINSRHERKKCICFFHQGKKEMWIFYWTS